MSKVCYRNLTSYKYQVMKDYTIKIDLKPLKAIRRKLAKFLSLSPQGILSINKYYAWDGPSGPTIDTRDFMRGSLVHDALYQLMREGVLDYRVHRQRADEILREICLEDGMCKSRACYVYQAVHIFAEGGARPQPEHEPEIICVP
ncbi:MAG: hypothetical protein ABSB38_08230 [Dehalococcoidia bacterium]|jgi:hypothetical protein